MSPTVLRSGPYRVFFYSNEAGEPAHVHVQREKKLAKFWLRPVTLAGSTGFSAKELRRLLKLIGDHREQLEEAWREFFSA